MFGSKNKQQSKKSEDVKKSAAKVLDPKKDTPTRSKHLRIFLDNADQPHETALFFENHYSHVFYIVYDAFVGAELNLRQKGAHKAQREELESVLYLLEKVLIYLPEHLGRKWQYHAMGRLMSKLLHPGNSWKLIKREAMRLFLLWYQILGDGAGDHLHAMFATLVPGFPSPYQGLGLTALAALTPDTCEGPVNPSEICPLIPPQSGERWRGINSPETDLTRIFLDVLLELMVSQVPLIEWKDTVKTERQLHCLNFLFERFKMYYMPHIFPDFNWSTSLYRPSLELPDTRRFRPAFVDSGDGTKKMDPMLACRVVVIKWIAQYTHVTRNNVGSGGAINNTLASPSNAMIAENNTSYDSSAGNNTLNMSTGTLMGNDIDNRNGSFFSDSDNGYEGGGGPGMIGLGRNSVESNLVREILYANRNNVNFVHEVYRQAFLLSFNHSPAIKKVITVYKDWIQMNVPELPAFLLEPLQVDRERDEFSSTLKANGHILGDPTDTEDYMIRQRQTPAGDGDTGYIGVQKENIGVRAGLQNVLQIFVTNASNVFLLEVSSEYPILLEEQVEMCKRVLNIYRYMVMNVKMEARTWEQLLFILLQITQLTLPDTPPRRREDTLGGRLAQAIFQTLIVTWIKANLYVVVSTELWDQFLDVLSSLTLWEELVREWAKTMETLTRVLARQVYNLDLNDLPLDRLNERAQKKRRGKQATQELKYSNVIKQNDGVNDNATNMVANLPTSSPATGIQGATIGNNQHLINRNGFPVDPSVESADSGTNSIIGPSVNSATTRQNISDLSGRKRLISDNSESHKFNSQGYTGKASSGRRNRNQRHGNCQHRRHRNSSSSNHCNINSQNGRKTKLRRSYSDSGGSLLSPSDPSNDTLMTRNNGRLRARSLDSMLPSCTCASWDDESEVCSRSCSPAPSSGMEVYACDRGSMKDSPMNQLMYGADPDTISEGGSIASDMLGDTSGVGHTGLVGLHGGGYATVAGSAMGLGGSSLTSSSTINQPRSVMGGGSIKGWLPDVAVVLWRRMLGSLGNINAIGDTVIHAQIYKYLIELFDIMVKIRSNQGVSLDNIYTPSSPEFVPPFTIFAPWCFRALNLPDSYARGRNYALRLLCLLTCRTHDAPLPKTHIVQFFNVLHNGLTGGSSYGGGGPIGFTGTSGAKMDTMNTLIRFTGPRFFSIMLPGYTAYILDFLYAANCIISTSDLKGVPRTEATSIVGTLLAFPPVVKDLPLLVPNPHCLELISSADVKDQIVGVLLKSGKKEPAGLARCISLSSLGIFVYSELLHESFHPKIKEAIQVLLTALRFNNKAVAQIASDMLLLLADHVKNFLEYYPEVPKKIVEVLARTLITLSPGGQQMNQNGQTYRSSTPIPTEDEKRLLLSLLFCLGEWVMRVPREILTQSVDNEGRTLLHHVFNALLISSCEPPGPSAAQVAASRHHAAEQQQLRRDGRDPGIGTGGVYSKTRIPGEPMGPVVMMTDFDPNIHVDNTKDNYNVASSTVSPLKTASKKGFSASKNEIIDNITKAAVAAASGQPAIDNSSIPNHNTDLHHPDESLEGQNRDENYRDTLPTSEIEMDDAKRNCPIRLASKTLMSHLVNHLFHFPMGTGGAASLSSMVNEQDDNQHYTSSISNTNHTNTEDLSPEIFKAPNVQLLVVNDTTLMSLVELPYICESSSTEGFLSSQQSSNNSLENCYGHNEMPSIVATPVTDNQLSQVRLIFRDISGKFSWDINPSAKFDSAKSLTSSTLYTDSDDRQYNWIYEMSDENSTDDVTYSSVMTSQKTIVTVTSHGNRTTGLLRHRDADTLPTAADTADDLDNLDDLLQHIGHTSPECLQEVGKSLNTIPTSNFLDGQIEKSSISGVLCQRNLELDHVSKQWNQSSNLSFEDLELSGKSTPTCVVTPTPSNGEDEVTTKALENSRNFQQARRLFSQLGFTSWERRSNVHLLAKSDQLLRELKHLDSKKCREAHKIAVIYVAEGQEDKQSILSNSSGSSAYEEFVSGLGWEVELDSHTGYMGGLVLGKGNKNKSTVGETSVYYATSFVEVMFHVSTRMSSVSEESMLSKTRHLGNDEVHVVWSEHWRDYRRGILPTEFCDVLIIVYPLKNTGGANGCPRLHRVQVSRKPDVPYFGPLFNEVVVDGRILPGLIRATAINASRAKRSMLPHYRTHYEERHSALSNIVTKHKSRTSFEEYVTQMYSPAPLMNLYTSSDIPGIGSYRSFTSNKGYPSPRSSSVASSTSTSHLSTSPYETSEATSQSSTTKSSSALLRPRTKTMAEFHISQNSTNQKQNPGDQLRPSMSIAERMPDRDNQIPLHLAEDSTSPRNLKKLTATFKDKLNLNNNLGSGSTFVNSTSSAQSASPTIIAQRTKKN